MKSNKKRRVDDSGTLILILVLLFISGLLFSSYVIYNSFEWAPEESPSTSGKIRLTILEKPNIPPPKITGESTIKFKIIEKPEE